MWIAVHPDFKSISIAVGESLSNIGLAQAPRPHLSIAIERAKTQADQHHLAVCDHVNKSSQNFLA